MMVDFFGLRMRDDSLLFRYGSNSRGMVEAKENQLHIGMYEYSWTENNCADEQDMETGEWVMTDREV